MPKITILSLNIKSPKGYKTLLNFTLCDKDFGYDKLTVKIKRYTIFIWETRI